MVFNAFTVSRIMETERVTRQTESRYGGVAEETRLIEMQVSAVSTIERVTSLPFPAQ